MLMLLVHLARRRVAPRALSALLLLVALAASACIIKAGRTDVVPVDPGTPVVLSTPVKAHLRDGSTVLYRRGVTVAADSLVGPGTRFGLGLADSAQVTALAIADVAGMESFHRVTDVASSATLSVLGSFAVASLAGLAAIAIFGSCPTIYSDSAGHQLLEAEGFSYSIAPLLEARDVDRLRVMPDVRGQVRLEVRNEAAETHFLNHLQLLDVERRPGEAIVPDAEGRPIGARSIAALPAVRDRAGRNVSDVLAAADGRVFGSDTARIRSAVA